MQHHQIHMEQSAGIGHIGVLMQWCMLSADGTRYCASTGSDGCVASCRRPAQQHQGRAGAVQSLPHGCPLPADSYSERHRHQPGEFGPLSHTASVPLLDILWHAAGLNTEPSHLPAELCDFGASSIAFLFVKCLCVCVHCEAVCQGVSHCAESRRGHGSQMRYHYSTALPRRRGRLESRSFWPAQRPTACPACLILQLPPRLASWSST